MFQNSDRGVSDVVAFTLTFSIIILSITTVSVVGIDNLTEFRDNERVKSAERGMVEFGSTMDDVHKSGAQLRNVRFALVLDERLEQRNDSTLKIAVEIDGAGVWHNYTYNVKSLNHRLSGDDDTTLSYQAGGVFRSDAAYPAYDPGIRCSTGPADSAIVSVVNITRDFSDLSVSSGDSSAGPDRVAQDEDNTVAVDIRGEVVANESGHLFSSANATKKNVYLNISEMQYRQQWGRYLATSGWTTVEDTTRYRCGVDNVAVRVTSINMTRRLGS